MVNRRHDAQVKPGAGSAVAGPPLSSLLMRPVANDASPYERLRNAIRDGLLEPGTPLVELRLAELCNVSRTPIREALTRLEQDGLVERGDRGYIVRVRSPEEILDIYEVRIVLETLAARLAAENRRPVDILHVNRAMAAYEAAPQDADPSAWADLNRGFHEAIWRASHSVALLDILDRLSTHLLRYPATTLTSSGRLEESIREHRDLAEAIVAGNPDLAAAVSTAHFTKARDIRLRLYGEESWPST